MKNTMHKLGNHLFFDTPDEKEAIKRLLIENRYGELILGETTVALRFTNGYTAKLVEELLDGQLS